MIISSCCTSSQILKEFFEIALKYGVEAVRKVVLSVLNIKVSQKLELIVNFSYI